MRSFLLLVLALSPSLSQAQEVTNIPQVGKHHRVLIVEKSFNRQNVISVYTKLDEKCRFLTDRQERDQPLLDFYWLNDRTSYEPFSDSIKDIVRGRLQVLPSGGKARDNSFRVALNDLKSVKHDLSDTTLTIISRANKMDSCSVEAFATLGPSAGNAKIQVQSIYVEGGMGGVSAVTISGHDMTSGKLISQRYAAAR